MEKKHIISTVIINDRDNVVNLYRHHNGRNAHTKVIIK